MIYHLYSHKIAVFRCKLRTNVPCLRNSKIYFGRFMWISKLSQHSLKSRLKKPRVFIALKKPLPEEIGNDLLAYVGCIAGAILIDDYRRGLLDAGFSHVEIVDTGSDLNVYAKIDNQSLCCAPEAASSKELPVAASGCCSPVSQSAEETLGLQRLAELLTRYNVNDYAASVRVYAIKPAA